MTDSTMEDLRQRVSAALESAAPPLRARPEWKDLDLFLRELAETGPVSEDLQREAEAKLDLLALANAEVDHALLVEQESRVARLSEDERLLVVLADECKVYIGLVVVALILPPVFLLMPLGVFLVLGALPAVYGFTRMRTLTEPTVGRIWLVLQDRVDEILGRVRILHGATIATLCLTGVWALVEILSERLAQL